MADRKKLAELRENIWVSARQGRFDIMHPGEYQLSVHVRWGIEDDQKAWFTLGPEHHFDDDENPGEQLLELGRAYLAQHHISTSRAEVQRMVAWLEAGDEYVVDPEDDSREVYLPPNTDVMDWACAHRSVLRLERRVATLDRQLNRLRRFAITNPWED